MSIVHFADQRASLSRRAETKKEARVTALAKLYQQPLPSTRKGALYNAFSYPTKISPEAIAVYIATHTQPGDTILDAFAGSGTAGVATLLCDRPTPAMREIAQGLGVNPKWGPRTAHLFEIGTLGSFISDTLCHPPEPEAFATAVDDLCRQAAESIGWLYQAKDLNGEMGALRHAIWSDILVCPNCGTEVALWDATVKVKPLSMADSFRCKSCRKQVAVDACERATEVAKDAFGRKHLVKKRSLARVHGSTGRTKWQRAPNADDVALVEKIAKLKMPNSAPDVDIEWGELRRAGYHIGIDKLHHFYTKRNFFVMTTLMELVSRFPAGVRDALRLLVLSYNSSHSTLMTRVVLKRGQPDFVLTGSQSGVLYISGLPVEKNILEGLRRKSKAFIDSFHMLHGSRSKVHVHNDTSAKMPLLSESVDYVFTDPPFGGYIPYAELNQINELWLERTTDRSKEVIVSPSQSKGVSEYGAMMGAVFNEMARVLKPDGAATVVFHSAHSEVWRALSQAYELAGFTVEATSVLDKIQSSFKQVVSTVSVKGDPLLLLSKRTAKRAKGKASAAELAVEVIRHAELGLESDMDPQRLYSRFVNRCLELGQEVGMDARDFYAFAHSEVTTQRVSTAR